MEKIKRFLFAPKSSSLKAALASQSNNVRRCLYLSRYMSEEYMRIRVRNHSNTSQGICRAMAHRISPITYYKLHPYQKGDEHCIEVIGTIRVEGRSFDEVVETSKCLLEEIASKEKVYLKLFVSDILARDETPWVEIFSQKNHHLSVEKWKSHLNLVADALNSEVVLWDAEIRDLSEHADQEAKKF